MKYINFLILVTAVLYVNGLQRADICFRTSMQGDLKCKEKHPYDCGIKYCTVSKASCREFHDLNFQIRSIKSPRVYENRIKKFQNLINSLKECV